MSKVWFITGAARGLGREIADAALSAGDGVVATARKPEKILESLGASDRLLALPLDVADQNQTESAVAAAVNRFGRVDVLVNNAGYGQLGYFETVEADAIRKQYETNVFGIFNVTRAVLPGMRQRRSGHILNLSSIGGLVGFGGGSIYGSTKFAVEGFSEGLAQELRPLGIWVTIVEPGFFRTDFLDNSSVTYGTRNIEDYAEAAATLRDEYEARNHKQLGDPKRLGAALVQVVQSDNPPLRFAAGSDAVKLTQDTLEARRIELDRWHELSVTTDMKK
ncbi:MAG: SDR family NAD(P)-dependent oxidoreductase [Bryobacteraceae bacterium]|nr:SDR family NAD(P)-dependent oxidoreductase [Bryobacteraceae bacterium]